MSISATTDRTQYTLTGSGQTLSFPYYFLATSDLAVIKTLAGVDSTLTLNVDYTVTGAGVEAGGSVIMTAGANGDVITIYRNMPQAQPTDFTAGGPLPATSIETVADRLTMLVQQTQRQVERSLRIPVSNSVVATMLKNDRKSKVVGFDSNGDLTYYAFAGGVIVPQSVQGTANQVLVNGGSGSAVTGAIILTLPQDIATTSTVRFGKLGINGAAVTNSDITVTRSLPGSTAQASIVVSGSLTPGAATDLHPNAFRDITTFTPTATADAYSGYDAQATVGGSVALNHFHGYQCRNMFTGTNTLDIMTGYATTNMGLNGAGVVTFLRGLYVSQPTITGGGSVGQFDGIYMDALTNSTGLVNAIYIAGANNVFMAGGQFGNSALLTYPAGATTCRGYFTFNQTSQTGLAIMNSNATATGTLVSFCNSGGTVQGTITQTNSTTVAYNTSSDLRLKQNIRDMTDSGAIIDALLPRVFDWRWGGLNYHGFIAQELVEIFPEAVTAGDEGTDPTPALILRAWGVDYSKLVPVLTAEVKSLRLRLAVLEAA